jgi:phosphoglycerate kinase
MNKKTIRDIDVQGKRVLVRVDFNVPVKAGVVTDDTRIRAALPTLNYLLEQGASLILCSHFGRPKDGPDPLYSLGQIVSTVSAVLGRQVQFVPECVGAVATAAAQALQPGNVLLLENTRFYKGETKNDLTLAAQLASLADIYVNDAFGSAHRAHASTAGVASYLPAVAGFLMEQELTYLLGVVTEPKRPFVAILGGAKVSDKIGVIDNLLSKADRVLIGGGMANTFYKSQGIAMGDSLVEDDALATATALLDSAGDKLVLPTQVVIADAFSTNAAHRTINVKDGVPAGWRVLDVVVDAFAPIIANAQTIVWNGPMGVFEFAAFAHGTNSVAQMVADSAATSIVGGGDSVAAVQQAGLADQITHISTGGGASLELLEGKVLPGVAALNER